MALSALINLALGLGLKATTRLPERSAAALFAFDIIQLCYLLALTGGVQNPFAALLLVPDRAGRGHLGYPLDGRHHHRGPVWASPCWRSPPGRCPGATAA